MAPASNGGAAAAGPPLADLVADQNLTATLKLLDAAIGSAEADYAHAAARLAQMHVNKGYCHQQLSLSRKALKDYDAALAIAPNSVAAHFRRGQVLQALNRREEAAAALRRAAELADAATDLALVADVTRALKALEAEGGAPPPAAAAAAATAAAPAGAGARGAGSSGSGGGGGALPELHAEASAAGEEPAVHAARAPHAALAAEPTADIAPHAPPAAAAAAPTAAAAPPAAKPKVAKGFFGAPPKAKPAAATPAAAPAAPAAAATAAAMSAAGGEAVDIDCAAAQDASRAAAASVAARPAGVRGGGVSVSAGDVSRMMQHSHKINLAVNQINAGQLPEAVALLDGVLADSPGELSARVARGTARALLRDLKGAIEDFDAAIKAEPRYSDSWKRRGQARSATGDLDGALTDLGKAAELMLEAEGAEASAASRAECLFERGQIYQRQRDYRRAAHELAKSTALDGSNPQAWNLLGLCRVSMGDIRAGVAAYEKAVELAPNNREAWLNMGQALKEEGRTREAERALSRLIAEPKQPGALAAYRLLAQMRQGQGRHADAAKLCDKALALGGDDLKLELLYLRAICRHALGQVKAAAADYDAVFGMTPRDGGSRAAAEEAIGYRFLSYFQREMALYLAHNIDRPVADFCLDTELSPVFKESWCKKGPIPADLPLTYKNQPPLPASPPPPPAPPAAELLEPLTAAADVIGGQLQNHHQGFLPNARQQRAAGYAAIELAQAVQQLLAERRRGAGLWVNSEGSSGQGGCSGRHLFGWRDAVDIVVKWRQLAEPNDQVVWVDLLTRREFEAGFGSHTPMYSGQTKCVRYYMNFERAFALFKRIVLAEGHAFDGHNRPIPLGSDDKREAVEAAATAWDMYKTVGKDCWVVVPLASVASPGKELEGTRLTLVRVPGQPEAVEFSIRTPVTPPRWKAFDAELEAAWERLVAAMGAGDQAAAARAILQFAYYWYNFMPLARGTAAVGYATVLSLFWAAGMPVTAHIPKDYQVDWEAILSQHPDAFTERLAKWMLPDAVREALGGPAAPQGPARTASGGGGGGGSPGTSPRDSSSGGGGSSTGGGGGGRMFAGPRDLPPVGELPRAGEVLATTRRRVEALNGPAAPRLQL